jgi:hypothetical protein
MFAFEKAFKLFEAETNPESSVDNTNEHRLSTATAHNLIEAAGDGKGSCARYTVAQQCRF